MHPTSQRILGQIIEPQPQAPYTPLAGPTMTLEQVVHPAGEYTGPERRAQGALIAEVVEDARPAARPAAASEES